MTMLTASFPMTASADLESRTIAGIAVPFGVVGNTNMGPTIVEAGALSIGDNVKLLVSHDDDRPIGKMADHTTDATGLHAKFRVIGTAAGDTALLEASEGIRDGLSVGLQVDDYTIAADGTVTVHAAQLREVSLVTFPAFTEARVQQVAASETDPEVEIEETQTPEADQAPDTNEGETVDESTAVVEAAAPADLPRFRVQDPFPYRPGVQASFFGDMLNAKHDVEAAQRVSIAQTMMQAAQTSADVEQILPDGYRPDLYVGQLGVTRPVIDSFQRFQIADSKPFRIPAFVSATNMIDDHTEGVNPTDGALEFTDIMVTPKAVSGQYTVSREVIDGSVPGIDQIIMNAIRQQYASDSETYAATQILTGATVGTAAETTVGVLGNMVDFQAGRKVSPDFFLAGTGLFPALAVEVDSAGRPLNPYIGATNASGTTSRGAARLDVQGYGTPLAWSLTGGLLGVATDAAVWESGLQMWRWEEVDGPANIRFAAFGYIAAAVLRDSGVVKFALPA